MWPDANTRICSSAMLRVMYAGRTKTDFFHIPVMSVIASTVMPFTFLNFDTSLRNCSTSSPDGIHTKEFSNSESK